MPEIPLEKIQQLIDIRYPRWNVAESFPRVYYHPRLFVRSLKEWLEEDEFNAILEALELGQYIVGHKSPALGKQISRADLIRRFVAGEIAVKIGRQLQLGVSNNTVNLQVDNSIWKFIEELRRRLQERQSGTTSA